jgi:hypothetical protein
MNGRPVYLRRVGAMLALLLTACADGGRSDQQRYVEVLREARPELTRDLARCAEIRDATLSGDCALAVAARVSVREPNACDQVQDGVWKDECWFQVMERRRRVGRWGEAVSACASAGRFRDRCYFHLWEQDILRVIQGVDWRLARTRPPGDGSDPTPPKFGSGDVAAVTQAAMPIFEDWSARIGEDTLLVDDDLPLGIAAGDTRFQILFWARVYVQLFEHDLPARSACDAAGLRKSACLLAIDDIARRHP